MADAIKLDRFIRMKKTDTTFDVAIIGAGASGLACARALVDQNLKVVIIEGRSRIGGRVYTERDSTMGHAVELGAEFMHGLPPQTLTRINNLGLPFYDTNENHFMLKGKGANAKLTLVGNFWEKLEKAMKALRTEPSKDRSFKDFVESKKSLDAETRRLLIAFVEGFHGADTELISEVGLGLSQQADEEDLNGAQNFRFIHGYDRLLTGFVSSVPEEKLLMKLSTTVKTVYWNSKGVELECESATGEVLPPVRAKKCVITVPIGVLKSSDKKSSIKFEPEVPGLKKSLDAIEMGHALRLVLRFRTRFWEKLTKEPIGYLHAGPEFDFLTWWSFNPLRIPLLTAWQGGPRAEKLAYLAEEDRVSVALTTLSKITGVKMSDLQQELQAWHSHNWTTDPYSLGAYSYIRVGGVTGAKNFSRPFASNLFFAGEATDSTEARGTVNGAIDSGLKVAKLILKQ